MQFWIFEFFLVATPTLGYKMIIYTKEMRNFGWNYLEITYSKFVTFNSDVEMTEISPLKLHFDLNYSMFRHSPPVEAKTPKSGILVRFCSYFHFLDSRACSPSNLRPKILSTECCMEKSFVSSNPSLSNLFFKPFCSRFQ